MSSTIKPFFRKRIPKIRRRLLRWYDAVKRPLPWRTDPSPYRTWISEMMLQQTTVASALPAFSRFLKRFPDIESLAKSSEEEVLSEWAGLGYYSRARNLRLAAQKLLAEFGGEIPREPDALRSLPGIGRYSAAAISSIAFGLPNELVDGNVIRVLARLTMQRGNPKTPAVSERIWSLAKELLERERPGDWNQSLMELGALVCLPSSPRCGDCPISFSCAAFAAGQTERFPQIPPPRKTLAVDWTVCLVRRNDKILLVRRGKDERFLPGLWGIPEPRHIRGLKAGRPLASFVHAITHHRISVKLHEGNLASKRLPKNALWASPKDSTRLLVSSLWKKCLTSDA